MITKQHTEEDLSKAYVLAVGAKAGLNVKFGEGHDYTVDGSLHEVSILNGKYHESGFSFDFQLKASKNCSIDETSIIYDFDADTYNYLCSRAQAKHTTPIVLLLLVLPQDESEWLSVSPEQMILKKACYWMKIEGNFTKNSTTQRIQIPQSQLFDVSAIQSLLNQIKTTGEIA